SPIATSRLLHGVRKPLSPGTSEADAYCDVMFVSTPLMFISRKAVRLPICDACCLRTATTSSQPSLSRSAVRNRTWVWLSLGAVGLRASLEGWLVKGTHCWLSWALALRVSSQAAPAAKAKTPSERIIGMELRLRDSPSRGGTTVRGSVRTVHITASP